MSLIDYPPYRLSNLRRTLLANVPQKALRDLANRLRFGARGPLSDEPVFVDPMQITHYYRADPKKGAPAFRRRHSGLVRGGDWDRSVALIEGSPKADACRRHFQGGESWEACGVIDLAMAEIARKGVTDGMRTRAEVEARYAGIDRLYDEIRQLGRLRLREELPGRFRREHGGIFGHVTREGRVVKAGGGVHRLALAQIAGLPEVPVQIGVVHPLAIADGHLERLRRSCHSGDA